MKRADSETLAYICGPEVKGDIASFTAKDHSFASGAKVSKRVALLNDWRGAQEWSVSYRVMMGAKMIANGTKNGSLPPAQTGLVPFDFALPKVSAKTDVKIEMTATIGAGKHTDTFNLRVFPALVAAKQVVTIFDPQGQTTALLKQLGYTTSVWKGVATPNLLVIGREALSKGAKLPGDFALGDDPHRYYRW